MAKHKLHPLDNLEEKKKPTTLPSLIIHVCLYLLCVPKKKKEKKTELHYSWVVTKVTKTHLRL